MGTESVGSAAEEAARLVEALSEWAGGLGGAHQAEETSDPAECRWCPICRVVHAVTHTSPEVREHLASAAASLVQAVAGILATHPPDLQPDDVHHDHEGEDPR